ncbi:MAG: hypothetical protein ACYSWZ_19005, partial [Planctomycetota bacterium]
QVREVYQEGVDRYRHTFDNTRIVIKRIQETIAANDEAVTRLDEVLNRAQIAVQALATVLATDYNPRSNQGSEMITASHRLQSSFQPGQRDDYSQAKDSGRDDEYSAVPGNADHEH